MEKPVWGKKKRSSVWIRQGQSLDNHVSLSLQKNPKSTKNRPALTSFSHWWAASPQEV